MLNRLKRYVVRRLIELLGIERRMINEIGFLGGLALLIRKRIGTRGATYRLKPRHAVYPLYYRHGSSDLDVFNQIFIDFEFSSLCDMKDVSLVIDCGANVGFTSAFFLSQFPSCNIVAVEPDSDNFGILQRNLKVYGSRAEMVQAGIWSHSAPLKISHERYRDGREWTVQVEACNRYEEPDIQGVSIESLLDSSGFSRISLLKIDIEGAEVVVFQGDLDWLSKVDAIAIELHDDSSFGEATEIFHAAISGYEFDITHSGDLTICRRRIEPVT